jgi:oxalate---CoA ligase
LTKQKPHMTRRRFPWTKEYDELARDAATIIRARCLQLRKPLNWAALELIFPAIPRNSVRQRCSKLEEAPGMDTYLQRLQTRWTELWSQYRNTPFLADPDLNTVTNFPIIEHVEFLRKHIDKTSLYVFHYKPFLVCYLSQIPSDVWASLCLMNLP